MLLTVLVDKTKVLHLKSLAKLLKHFRGYIH